MRLDKRNLRVRMRGEDVAQLQAALRRLKFDIEDREGYFGRTTRQAVLRFQEMNRLEITGEVDLYTAEQIKEALAPDLEGGAAQHFVVEGYVRQADGTPVTKATVCAYHKGFRTELLLGEVTSDRIGFYRIVYSVERLLEPGREQANLLVRAYGEDEKEIATSTNYIRFQASENEEVNLVVGGGEYREAPEYINVETKLAPIIADVALSDLTAEDVAVLVGESGQEALQIDTLVQANRLSNQTGIEAGVFYAMARQQLPMDLRTLLRQDPDVWRQGLEEALASGVIPVDSIPPVDKVINKLAGLAVEQELEGEDSLGALLRTSPILKDDEASQRTFVTEFLDHDGPVEALWEKLRGRPGLDEGIVDEFQFSLELGDLVQGYTPLTQALQMALRAERIPPKLRDLARWDAEAWRVIVTETGYPPEVQGETEEEKVANYVQQLMHRLETAYPSAVVTYRLVQDLPEGDDTTHFLTSNPDFDLGATPIERYLAENNFTDNEVEETSRGVIDELNLWQRLYRISPKQNRYHVMRTLKASGLDSAQAIVQLGQPAFLREVVNSFANPVEAQTIWEKASDTSALAIQLLVQYNDWVNSIKPFAVPTPSIADLEKEWDGTPTLRQLFGSQDFCECEHCESIYSPAAYIVDLLQFLKHAVKKQGQSPLSVLHRRRPDLAEIELSCINTNRLLPYVDLVNEVLENAVSWFQLQHSAADLNDEILHPQLRQKFSQGGFRLSQGATLTVVEKGQEWRIDDDPRTLVIFHTKNGLQVYVLMRHQTKGTQDELSVLPEHQNDHAYKKLANATYPWLLPFYLWQNEAQLHLKHLGLNRYEWMENLMLRQPAIKAQDVADDHLGLAPLQRDLITGSAGHQEYKLWGVKQQDWPEKLRQVRIFLNKAGFDIQSSGQIFSDLRQLVIGTCYVNENNSIRLDPPLTCDLDQAKIENDVYTTTAVRKARWEAILSRVRRFLRLQRALGWSIPELDKAITALGTPLDQGFLVDISNIERLMAELKVPLVQMLSWWAVLDTAEDKAELDPTMKVKSLYEQLFLDKSVDTSAQEAFKLNATHTELATATDTISKHATNLVGALEISITDLKRLVKVSAGDEGPVADLMNLANLSSLYRHVSLAKTLKLSVKELLAGIALTGDNPFSGPQTTLKFVKKVRRVQKSGFRFAELDYMMRHRFEVTDDVAPTDGEIGPVMGEIRQDLSKIIAKTTDQPDSDGKHTAKMLAHVLKPAYADETMALLKGLITYKTSLANLPQGYSIPATLQSKATFDPVNGELRFTGAMTIAEKAALQPPQANAVYKDAVENVFQQPRTFVTKKLADVVTPANAIAQLLDTDTLSTPEKFAWLLTRLNTYLRRTLSYNLTKQKISTALGIDTDVTALLLETLVKGQLDPQAPIIQDFVQLAGGGLSAAYYANTNFQGAPTKRIDASVDFDWSQAPSPAGAATFSVRWKGLLQAKRSGSHSLHMQANGHARLRVNERLLVNAWTGAAGQVDVAKSMELEAGKYYPVTLEYRCSAPSGAAKLSWKQPMAAEEVVPKNRLFAGEIVTSYRLLHKLVMLISGFKIQADELRYLYDHSQDFDQFDLNQFPLDASGAKVILFTQWLRLDEVFTFRDLCPKGRTRLIDVFGAAYQNTEALSISEAKKQLSKLIGWNARELDYLAGTKGFRMTSADFRQGTMLAKLYEGFRLIRQLGISAQQLVDWTQADLTEKAVALEMRQVVRAKYDREQWLKVARPLRDELRRKQREALVDYLVHDYELKDTNELFDRFLVDVEMDSCMLTSRLKQAISSVQLFVMRSLMNLEPDVDFSPGDAKEWKWRRNYRVWEANRKVFLYPENWIEPDLRDDKSPFFQELENELLQNEITKDTAETAFLNYLDKLDEVARLEIAGLYQDDEQKILHVVGRTTGTPHVYYYRRRVDEVTWTPWERVDADIEGEHVIPVAWNRRLYLFWPIFEQKEIPRMQKDLPNYQFWVVKMAWSEYKNGRWSPKRVYGVEMPATYVRSGSPPFLVPAISSSGTYDTICERPIDSSFQALYLSKDLRIRCFWSMYSPELANRKGWPIAEFRLKGCNDSLDLVEGYTNLQNRQPVLLPAPSVDREYMTFADHTFASKLSLQLPFAPTLIPNMNVDTQADFNKLQSYLSLKPVLKTVEGYNFRLIVPHQSPQMDSRRPFFYEDDLRTFLVEPLIGGSWSAGGSPGGKGWSKFENTVTYHFSTFFHPFVCDFVRQLRLYNIEGLLNPDPLGEGKELLRQEKTDNYFYGTYGPHSIVDSAYPVDEIDFSEDGAYAHYNWELFFHIPLLIADCLSNNQRFEEATKWFHFIFDPTFVPLAPKSDPVPARFWKLRPFHEAKPKSIETLLRLLNKGDPEIVKQVQQWRKNPFKPHAIARLRQSAYMKTVVMKYLDNLIAWGDQLFRRDSIESINEATQLYVLAAQILGDRPHEIPARPRKARTYRELSKLKLDVLSNALITIENWLPVAFKWPMTSGTALQESFTIPDMFYFCIPHNEMLLKYWSTVEDRLFKIRHCMNIKGIVRQLPLFQPPIDPAILVRAAAAGVDISSVLNDLNAPLPHYRFQIMVLKAVGLCAEVRALGAALLAALEKRDAEELARLRAQQEVKLLKLIRSVKKKQVEEAKEALAGLDKAADLVEERRSYYEKLIENELTANEQLNLSMLRQSHDNQKASQVYDLAASVAHLLPTITYTQGMVPSMSVAFGGPFMGTAYHAFSQVLGVLATADAQEATTAAIRGGHNRRAESWQHEVDLALIEEEGMGKKIEAAKLRQAIAQAELSNHDAQIEDAKKVDSYLLTKFTNQQLYNWMVSQISTLYFQSYQLAYDLAKRTERAFQHELGVSSSSYIQFGYWDSLKKGLMAGERLHYDLKRMDVAYLEQNRREFEITKHVSLNMLDPEVLVMLRQTGQCYFRLPEVLFDLDYPGHYMRRIKSVSLTLPCVAGPFTSVNCTLTLHGNRIRRDSTMDANSGEYAWTSSTNDSRFIYDTGGTQSIATSSGQNDSGVFELNFRDDRFLPFEGAGAISAWHLELPVDLRQFDYDTISDIIIHIRYTARDGGSKLKKTVEDKLLVALKTMALDQTKKGLFRLFSARQEFSNEWNAFFSLVKEGATAKHKMQLDLTSNHFPYIFQKPAFEITINKLRLFLKLKYEQDYQKADQFKLQITPPGDQAATAIQFKSVSSEYNGLPQAKLETTKKVGTWLIEVTQNSMTQLPLDLRKQVTIDSVNYYSLDPKKVEDLLILCEYTITKT